MWDQPEVHDVYRSWRAHPRAVRRRPDGGRRGLDPDAGVDGPLRATRRATPGLQLRLAAGALVGGGVRRRGPRHPGRCGPGGCVTDVGAVQPRRDPPPHEVRRRTARPGPGPRRHAHDAGAAGVGVPLPGRGARARGGRRTTGGPAGPLLVPHRQTRSRRRPGADPVARDPVAVRLRARGDDAVAADAGRLGDGSPSPPSARTRTRPGRSTARLCAPGDASPTAGATSRSSTGGRRCSTCAAATSPSCATAARGPVRLPTGEVVVASGPLDGGLLPPDTAVWVAERQPSGQLFRSAVRSSAVL